MQYTTIRDVAPAFCLRWGAPAQGRSSLHVLPATRNWGPQAPVSEPMLAATQNVCVQTTADRKLAALLTASVRA